MFCDVLNNEILLRVRLQPNSSSCRISGVFTGVDNSEFLKICVVSVPEKGKANKELIDFLAKKMKIAKSKFEIVSGEFDHYKKIKIIENNDILLRAIDMLLLEIKNDCKSD